MRFIQRQLRREPGRKVLVFAHHKSMLMALEAAMRGARTAAEPRGIPFVLIRYRGPTLLAYTSTLQ
jgi:hypothetical protein